MFFATTDYYYFAIICHWCC